MECGTFLRSGPIPAEGAAPQGEKDALRRSRTILRMIRTQRDPWRWRRRLKRRGQSFPPPEQKAKYGEITLLDFPQFTKDTFPGVTHMDLYSGFFGDVGDNSMYFPEGSADQGFDPLSPSGRKWLDRLANVCVKTGMKVQHISNNAPTNLAEYGSPEKDALRKAGVAMGKRWIEGLSVLGVKSMRMNSPRALGPEHPSECGSARARRRIPAEHRYRADDSGGD